MSLSGRVAPEGRKSVLGDPGLRCDVVVFVLWHELFYVDVSGLLLVWRRWVGACVFRGLPLENAIGDLLRKMVFASLNDYALPKLVSQ